MILEKFDLTNFKSGPGANLKYPWDKMEPGHSLFIECDLNQRATMRNKVMSAARLWFKRNRPEFKIASKIESAGIRIILITDGRG